MSDVRNDATRGEILAGKAAGLSDTITAQRAGIDPRTLKRWSEEEPALRVAMDQQYAMWVATRHKSAEDDGEDMALLERRAREDYGRVDTTRVEIVIEAHTLLPPEALRAVAHLKAEMLTRLMSGESDDT